MVVVWSSSWPSREKRWPELLLLVTRKLAKMSTGTIVDRIDPFAKRSLKKAGDDGWVQLLILNCWTTFTLFTVCIFFDNIQTCLQYSIWRFHCLVHLPTTIFQNASIFTIFTVCVFSTKQYSNKLTIFFRFRCLCHLLFDNIPTSLQYFTLSIICVILSKTIFQQSYDILLCSLSVPSSMGPYSNRTTISYPVRCCAFVLLQYSKCHNILPCSLLCFLSLTIFQQDYNILPCSLLCFLSLTIFQMPQYLTLFTVVLSFSDNIPNAYNILPCALSMLSSSRQYSNKLEIFYYAQCLYHPL